MWDFFYFKHMEKLTGFTCQTCGKVFENEEEFKNRHKKRKKDKPKNKD